MKYLKYPLLWLSLLIYSECTTCSRESVKNYLLSFFGHNDFPLRGGGVPLHSAREKIRYKTAIFGQKTLILALFDPFF